MKPKFIISKIKPNQNGVDIDKIFSNIVLRKICFEITKQKSFDVEFKAETNKGRLAILITKSKFYYITISGNDPQRGRNSFFQSVPTAYSLFLADNRPNKEFYVCVNAEPYSHLTSYHKFVTRLIVSSKMKLIDISATSICKDIKPFVSVIDIILNRNMLGCRNAGNNATYITDEGNTYNIYGKTFGANGKEVVLLCLALISLSDKSLRLFQIADNDALCIGSNDIDTIYKYSALYGMNDLDILDDTFDLQRGRKLSSKETFNLRSPRFVYNLLKKTNGEKTCALCDCNVSPLIQAAHIYGVSDIRKNDSATKEEKISMANDGDNGLWLCMNHHKLFDENLITITTDHIALNDVKNEYRYFVEQSLTKNTLDKMYINEKTTYYLSKHVCNK